jgi:hypothetical protein
MPLRHNLLYLFTLLPLTFASSTAQAQTSETTEEAATEGPGLVDDSGDRNQIRYQNLTLGRYNPLGLFNQLTLGYRHSLYGETDSVLKNGSYVAFNVTPAVSPAWARGGAQIEIQPLALLRLSATYEGIGYFGSFDALQSYQTANADWSEEAQEATGEIGAYSTSGTILTLSALLQAKVGPIAARSNYRAIYQSMSTQNGDPLFYDLVFDVLAPNNGFLHTVDSDLLFLHPNNALTVGLRHTYTHASYDETMYLAGESVSEGREDTHRLGPLVAYRLNQRTDMRFSQPTLILIMNWWLQHPYRTGQETAQGVPYVVAGFAFNGRLDTPRR